MDSATAEAPSDGKEDDQAVEKTSHPSLAPAPPLSAVTPPKDEELYDINYSLLTPDFVRACKLMNDGNSRDLNRARAVALGFTQKGLKALFPSFFSLFLLNVLLYCFWYLIK